MANPHHEDARSGEESAEPQRTIAALRRLKLSAIGLCALVLAGIVGLMILSAGKGEDITGIVAPALLIALVSGLAAAVAAVLQKRAPKSRDPKSDHASTA